MKTPSSTSMPAKRPPAIFSRRLRRCFFDRALPLGLAVTRGGGRPPEEAPARAAVVRARPLPAAGRRAPPEPPEPPERPFPVGRPPPPVGRLRVGGGRRTDPARGATGEVSSWLGTRQPLSDCGVVWRRRARPGRHLMCS